MKLTSIVSFLTVSLAAASAWGEVVRIGGGGESGPAAASKDPASKDTTSKNAASKEAASTDVATPDAAPVDAAPDAAPVHAVPVDAAAAEPAVTESKVVSKALGRGRPNREEWKRKHWKVRNRGRREVVDAAERPEPEVDPETLPLTHHLDRWEGSLGFSALWTDSPGLVYFSDDNLLARMHLRLARSFIMGERLSLAISPEWNAIGSADAGIRNNASRLDMSEFSVGVELRYLMWTRFAGYVRLSPGVTLTQAQLSVDELKLGRELWGFHGDLSLGASALIAGNRRGDKAGGRLHVFVEAGYDWVPSTTLTMSPQKAPERTASFEIPNVSLRAPHIGAGLFFAY